MQGKTPFGFTLERRGNRFNEAPAKCRGKRRPPRRAMRKCPLLQ